MRDCVPVLNYFFYPSEETRLGYNRLAKTEYLPDCIELSNSIVRSIRGEKGIFDVEGGLVRMSLVH
jgi:hypothetical protein